MNKKKEKSIEKSTLQKNKPMKKWLFWIRKYSIIVGFFGILILFSLLSDRFLTSANLLNVLRQVSINAIMAFGMTFVILSGGIDLSVGSVFAFSAVVGASILKQGQIFWGIMAALGVGSALGFANGLIVAKARLQPFIVTLAMMAIARSFTNVYTDGRPITGFADSFRDLGRGDWLGIPVPVILMFAVFGICLYLLSNTKLGLYTYAIGGNEEATRLSGIPTQFYKTLIYTISGFLSGASAMVLTARLNSAQPVFGVGYELDAIAAVVLGGISLSGGKGSLIGTLFGAMVIGVINNGMNLINVSPFYQQAVKGGIILLAVLVESKD